MVNVQILHSHLRKFANARQAAAHFSVQLSKAGSIGGDQEGNFEQAFASLGYSYLKDKSPRLLEYIVGFELLDRNDDMTQAVGVFGFKAGSLWLYVPIFFLNGELRGHELLYVKNQDMFVPMKENWVNYLLSKQPHILGEGSPRDSFQLGAMWPDLRSMNNSYRGSKYASAMPEVQEWAAPFMPSYARLATTNPVKLARYDGMATVKDLLHNSCAAVKVAMDICDSYPRLQKAFDDVYGADLFSNALRSIREKLASLPAPEEDLGILGPCKTAEQRPVASKSILGTEEEQHPVKTGALKMMRVDMDQLITPNIPDDATRYDATNRGPDGLYFDDKRPEYQKSTIYNTTVSGAYTNPTDSQVSEVLTAEGQFTRCLVLKQPYAGDGQQPFMTLVRLAGEKDWMNADSTCVWVRQEPTSDEFRKWFGTLSEGRELREGGTYMFVCADGAGTVPFRVKKSLGNDTYTVSYDDHCDKSGVLNRALYPSGRGLVDGVYSDYSSYDAILKCNNRKGSSFKAIAGELYVPESARLLTLEPAKEGTEDDPCCSHCESSDPPLRLGNLIDVQLQIVQKTAEIKLWPAGDEMIVTSRRGQERLSKKATLASLVMQHGLPEKDARETIKIAESKHGARFRILYAPIYEKLAYGFGPGGDLLNQGPTAPTPGPPPYGSEMPIYGGAANIYPQEELLEVPGLSAAQTDPYIYDPLRPIDPNTANMSMDAAQTGQKEVFDTSMLSTLLKSVRQDSIVDRYLGDLMKGLDRLGRILFSSYWHMDAIKERYGAGETPELMDGIRNAFDAVGDVTLKLRQNSVNPDMMELGEPSIKEVASVS